MHLPALCQIHWTQKLTAKKSRFKFCELFSVGALQQIACMINLGSADTEHIDSSDQSAA